MLKLKVINLWTGPGAGKSTLAAGLFNLMKTKGHRVELVTEFAKDLTYGKDFGSLQNQLLILAQQDHRVRRLEGQVEWAITDSPLPLGIAYMTSEYAEWLTPATWAAFHRYRNYNVHLLRGDRPYHTYGRNQSREEAVTLDNVIANLYEEANDYDGPDFGLTVKSDWLAPYDVYNWLMAEDEEED